MKGRVPHYIVKPCLRLAGSDIPTLDRCFRIKEFCHLHGFYIQFTSVDVRFCGNKVKKTPHAAGKVCHKVMFRQFQAGCYKFAQAGRRKELAVFNLFLCLAVCMVILVVRPLQTVKAAIAGIGIINILRADRAFSKAAAVDQVQDFFIQCFSFILRDGFLLISIFHSYHLANIWFSYSSL